MRKNVQHKVQILVSSQYWYQKFLRQICFSQMDKKGNLRSENNIKLFVCEAI